MDLTDKQRAQLQQAPILVKLLTDGKVWAGERGDIEGKAGDGVVVCLGSVYDIPGTGRYLTAHPTPDSW
jgi:hypothetical protein